MRVPKRSPPACLQLQGVCKVEGCGGDPDADRVGVGERRRGQAGHPQRAVRPPQLLLRVAQPLAQQRLIGAALLLQKAATRRRGGLSAANRSCCQALGCRPHGCNGRIASLSPRSRFPVHPGRQTAAKDTRFTSDMSRVLIQGWSDELGFCTDHFGQDPRQFAGWRSLLQVRVSSHVYCRTPEASSHAGSR